MARDHALELGSASNGREVAANAHAPLAKPTRVDWRADAPREEAQRDAQRRRMSSQPAQVGCLLICGDAERAVVADVERAWLLLCLRLTAADLYS